MSALFVAVIIAGIAAYKNILSGVNEVQDYALRQIAYSLQYSNNLPVYTTEENDDNDNESIENVPDNDNFDFIAQIWNAKGRLIFASHPDGALPRFSNDGIGTVNWQHEDWRVFSLTYQGEIIQVGQPQNVRNSAAASLALHALIPIVALLPVLGVLIWFGVSFGLRPLGRITAYLQERHADTMRPLPTQELPSEINALVLELNSLLMRLSASFDIQRNFIADAAHQLRTPLTAMLLHAEIITQSDRCEEKEEEFQRLKQSIKRMSHLVKQLLILARQQPDAERVSFSEVDLDALARQVIGELSTLAESRNVDLGLISLGELLVFGNQAALSIMLINLVDNAIRYIPENHKIDIRIYRQPTDHVVLEVEDNGPGIPENERERVFDRFYRGNQSDPVGSGLGLAIVRNIVLQHQGTIVLATGKNKGLLVRISLSAWSNNVINQD
ncbi:MAG: HAMP domain-containing histidine kinase [Pseudomonadales bacterium]|nr:HAMP domain-containing histidine kinase [Pseudomonadales bacterium]